MFSIIDLCGCCDSEKKRELATSNPQIANLATYDYTAFTTHVDQNLVRKISNYGLDVTMSTNNSIGQS